MIHKILLYIRNHVLHIMVTKNSAAEWVSTILCLLMPADMCSKVYFGWTIWKTCFIIFLELVCLAYVLHHLFWSRDNYHEVVHMDEDVLIIMFTYRKTIIGHYSNILHINIHFHLHIYVSSTRREYQGSHKCSDWWLPCRYSTLNTIHRSDNDYYYSLVKTKLLSRSEPYPFLLILI